VLKKFGIERVLPPGTIGVEGAGVFCGWLNGRGRRTDTRVERSSGSSDTLSEQFGQADGVVGGHREGELPIDLEQSAVPHLRKPATVLAQPKASSTRLRMRCEIA